MTDRKAKKPSALKGHERKFHKKSFEYVCEWIDCKFKTDTMNLLNHHVCAHRRGYTSCLGKDEDLKGGEYLFFCYWQDCGAQIQGEIDDFSRHVFYHTFHQYLKHIGQHVMEVESIMACNLGTQSRNVIPELPEKLRCRWDDCELEYDNPYIFYSHVTHHCEDFPKGNDPKVAIQCKWEGCTASTKSCYKMKEHVRSHTQAKVVACPTCGALFSNNTKFLDHLKRQTNGIDLEYECTHCHNKFSSERIMKDHMRRHVNHYKCPMCDMTCYSPSSLRDHIRYRHSTDREFNCDQCENSFKSQSDLRRHQEFHQKTSTDLACPFPDCPKTFQTAAALKKHKTGEHGTVTNKTFQCHLCSTTFPRGAHLTRHLTEDHQFRWPSGHNRFSYKLQADGYRRLQTVRYESIEVSEQVLGTDLTEHLQIKDDDDRSNTKKTKSGTVLPNIIVDYPCENVSSAVSAPTVSLSQPGGSDAVGNYRIQMLPEDSASLDGEPSGSGTTNKAVKAARSEEGIRNEEEMTGKKVGRKKGGGGGGRRGGSKKQVGKQTSHSTENDKDMCSLFDNDQSRIDSPPVANQADALERDRRVTFNLSTKETGTKPRGKKRRKKEENGTLGDNQTSTPKSGRKRSRKKQKLEEGVMAVEKEEENGELGSVSFISDAFSSAGTPMSGMPSCYKSGFNPSLSNDSSNSSTLYTLSHIVDDDEDQSLSRAGHLLNAVLLEQSPEEEAPPRVFDSMPDYLEEEAGSPTRYMLNSSIQEEEQGRKEVEEEEIIDDDGDDDNNNEVDEEEAKEIMTEEDNDDEDDDDTLVDELEKLCPEAEETETEEEEEGGGSGKSPVRYTLATPRDECSRSPSPTLYTLPSPIDGGPHSPSLYDIPPQSPTRYKLNSPFGGSENAQSPTRYALNSSPHPFNSERVPSPTLYSLKSPSFSSFGVNSSPTRYTLQSVQEVFDENAQSPTNYSFLNSSLESNTRYALETPTRPSRNVSGQNESFRTSTDDGSRSPTLYTLKSPFHEFSSSFHTVKVEESPYSVTLTEENTSKTNPNSGGHNLTFSSPCPFKSPHPISSPSHRGAAATDKSPLNFRSAFSQLIRAADGIEGPRTSSPVSMKQRAHVHFRSGQELKLLSHHSHSDHDEDRLQCPDDNHWSLSTTLVNEQHDTPTIEDIRYLPTSSPQYTSNTGGSESSKLSQHDDTVVRNYLDDESKKSIEECVALKTESFGSQLRQPGIFTPCEIPLTLSVKVSTENTDLKCEEEDLNEEVPFMRSSHDRENENKGLCIVMDNRRMVSGCVGSSGTSDNVKKDVPSMTTTSLLSGGIRVVRSGEDNTESFKMEEDNLNNSCASSNNERWETYNLEMLGEVALKTHSQHSV